MTSQNGSHYFSNASNLTFHNTTFMHVSGNAYSGRSERFGLRLLLKNISKGASHDAAERGEPPRCHPHTRTAIQAEIMKWIEAPDAMRKLILWMYGPAGSGKTAIAQSIADECKRQGVLAASFFFGRFAAGRNNTTRFVATIAYQLWQSITNIREQIVSAVEQNPNIFSLDLATQMRVLVIEPLRSLPPSPTPIFVIMDGVDECGPNRESHTTLLNSLATAILELQHIPLIFLIASRPEYEIRSAFNGKLLSPLVKSLVLDDNYKPDDDIRLYINSTFQEIRNKHACLGSHLPSSWPAKTDVDCLISKASGQFIFASTVMKFIDSTRYHPPEQLNIILGLLEPGNKKPFTTLDALYHFILSSVADLPKVLEILTFLVLANFKGEYNATIDVAEAFLGFAISPVLVDMHALVFVPPDYRRSELPLRIHHASLYDFLTDRSRSHEHYINITQGHITLSRRWLELVANFPHIPAPLSLRTCVGSFVIHTEKLAITSSEIAGDLASFSLTLLLNKIHDFNLDLYGTHWNGFFTNAKKQAGRRVDVFPRLRDEFDAFVLQRLSQYPSSLRDLIPSILVYGTSRGFHIQNVTTQNIFRLFFYASTTSKAELAEGRKLDSTLLDLYNLQFLFEGPKTTFATFFKKRSRARQSFVDGRSFAILAKQMVRSILPMPGRDKHQVEFVRRDECQCVFSSDTSHPTVRIPGEGPVHYWFSDIIINASADLELAVLLRERVLQYDDREFGIMHHWIAKIGLEYIKKCGIPFLKHIHLQKTNRCIVCEEYSIATVVIDKRSSVIQGAAPRISIHDRLAFFTR